KKDTEEDWSMADLQAWLSADQQEGYAVPLLILGSLSAINIILLILFLIGLMKPFVIISFVIYLLTYNYYADKVSGLFDEATQIEKLLSSFRECLLFLESFSYRNDSRLQSFCAIFRQRGETPSNYLKKIIRISSAASSQGSELVWLLLNSLVPWDLYFAKRLNAYKKDLEPKLQAWLDRFYQLEALNSIANFAWLNPEYTFSLPRDDRASPILKAKDLGHPLIPKEEKVTNDVTIKKIGDIHLITGSNMAGKSTFLRTVGINLALCMAGAPVNASSFDAILVRLFSSINVTDSLNEGLSHFYAEVKRLRALMDRLNSDHSHPLFFFVDEIYRGTNNRERLAGSDAFLKEIAGKNGIGLVTTHDLELAQLEREIPALTNWHFEETIEDGEMYFEYKLKPGPCSSTNALKIMEREGLPV
ncbi:MAG TPA: MutS family DNA mismatch repair protein, partial [Balneolaceae bacterium]|nr:MutS family DNA mismatch repair protein [Balneolaceae bacterium]